MKLVLDSYTEGLVIFDQKKDVRYINPRFRNIREMIGVEDPSKELDVF